MVCVHSLTIAIAFTVWWEGIEMLKIFAYRALTVEHFTDQN